MMKANRSRNTQIKGKRKQQKIQGIITKLQSNTTFDEVDFDERRNVQTVEKYQFQSYSMQVKNQAMMQRSSLVTAFSSQYKGLQSRLQQAGFDDNDRKRNPESLQKSLFADTWLSVAEESEPQSPLRKQTHSPKKMSPLHAQKKIIFNSIFQTEMDPYKDGLATPPDDDFDDSSLSNSMDDSMEIAPEIDMMERYSLNFNIYQENYEQKTTRNDYADYNPLMTSEEVDQDYITINREEIELRVDTSDESGANDSLQYGKNAFGSIDLFEFSNLKQLNYRGNDNNRGRIGRCSFQNKNMLMINENSVQYDSPNLSII